MPPVFNTRILEDTPARAATIFRSKGVGEPPLLLAIAVWSAIRDADGSLARYRLPVDLEAPATPERILMAVADLKTRMSVEGRCQDFRRDLFGDSHGRG